MFLKIIAYGFTIDINSYLTDIWSKLDFFIVTFSILDLSLSSLNLGFLKIIRMLRILRPLRFINKNPNMKILVNCLFDSLGSLANVTIVIFLILYYFLFSLMFGILFITLLNGNSGFCFLKTL